MVEIWYGLVALLLTGFAVLEGWDFGVGAVLHRVAKTPAERRQVVEAIGPLWGWNEVWLIAAGGTLLVAFPRVMATALSGYYLAVFLLLWCLILRGMALEVGGHVDDPLWRQFWDVVFAASSALLAVLFGAAFGNVVRGVPLTADGRMFMPLFTDFMVRGRVGLLDWYTLSAAAFSLVLLAAHGATYLVWKTDGDVHRRSERLAGRLWPLALLLLVPVSAGTLAVRPDFFGALGHRPAGVLAALVIAASLAAVFIGHKSGKDQLAFFGSCGVITGLLGGAAASMFPVMLHSTLDPAWSLTAYNGAADRYGLGRALIWWPAALALSLVGATIVARRYRGRVRAADADALS
jgi:cytochrome d ubiquinol oxidase subunit II